MDELQESQEIPIAIFKPLWSRMVRCKHMRNDRMRQHVERTVHLEYLHKKDMDVHFHLEMFNVQV